MRKLKLQLEDLQIDSFQTTSPEKPKGTVFGEQCTCYTQCTCPGCPTCAGYGTCDASCNGTCQTNCNCSGATCDASCNGTCDWTCDYAECGGTETQATAAGPRQICQYCP
jgi:hypothetical protein